jgi:medium-chain acyl-[acyl-carrier-protein] hydrolase
MINKPPEPDSGRGIKQPADKIATKLPEPNIWRETYPVRSYEVDCNGRLSAVSVFNFLQDAASKHAQALGVSVHSMLSQNHTWLLSRLKIKLDSYPGFNEPVEVATWPSGSRRLFAMRDFELTNGAGNIFARAVSGWLVLDTLKRRPVRVSSFVERLNPVDDRHALPDLLEKLPPLKESQYQRVLKVRHRDLDVNRHANNVSFVEWILEGLPPGIQETAMLTEFEINFMAEVFASDVILTKSCPTDESKGEYCHTLVREGDGRELARARSVWKEL